MRVQVPPLALQMMETSIAWNSNIAYAIGLLVTDGSLSKDGRHIIFTSKDYNLILAFNYCLHIKGKITINPKSTLSKHTVYKIQTSNVALYRWLNTIGIFSQKTFTISKLHIPDAVFRDFLRGHLDGDGSIVHYKDKYLTTVNKTYVYDRLFIYFLSASKNHIQWIQRSIQRLYCIHGSINILSNKSAKKHDMYRLKFSTKEAKMLLPLLYWNTSVPCLQRKFVIAKQYL